MLVVTTAMGMLYRVHGDPAPVAGLLLEAAHDGSLGHAAHRQDVAHQQRRLLASVDELARVHALRRYHGLHAQLVAVRVPEAHLREGCTSVGVMNDILDHALDVTVSLSVIDGAELSRALAMLGVSLEHTSRSLTLRSDHATHC